MATTTVTDMTGYFQRFSTDKACRDYLIDKFWKNGPICPYCKNDQKIYVYKSRNLHKCAECKKQFSVTTGTIFADSNLPLHKIFLAYYLISINKKGISSTQMGRLLGISQKAAWYLSHKIRNSLQRNTRKKITGTVEVDETYVGGKMKGGKRGRGSENKTPVFGMLQRNGELIIMPVPDAKRKTLQPLILLNVKKGSRIMSDEWWAYTKLYRDYTHQFVKHKEKEYVRGNIHVNSLEGAWSLLKRSIRGVYHRPSRKHLAKYCDEFQFKYNTRDITDFDRFEKAIARSNISIKQKSITET
jgi:transposase-like protein